MTPPGDNSRSDLPPNIVAHIQQAIAELEPAGIGHVDYEGRTHDALPLTGTIGSTWLLRADGTFWDVDADFGKPLTPLPREYHTAALVAGTERYPWLAELLPDRPASAVQCAFCIGEFDATSPDRRSMCPRCSGLGWHAP